MSDTAVHHDGKLMNRRGSSRELKALDGLARYLQGVVIAVTVLVVGGLLLPLEPAPAPGPGTGAAALRTHSLGPSRQHLLTSTPIAHGSHIRSRPGPFVRIRRFAKRQLNRPNRSGAVPRSQPDSDSQAGNASSTLVTRSTSIVALLPESDTVHQASRWRASRLGFQRSDAVTPAHRSDQRLASSATADGVSRSTKASAVEAGEQQ